MKWVAEVFSQGEEVVSGQTVDSNAAWLAQRLNELGFEVRRHTAVGDELADLVGLMHDISQRADCCICTGGLGPTVDDLTSEAASIAAGQALQFDDTAFQHIQAYFARRQRDMPAINRKQAYLPTQAERIDNPVGTAPGFALQIGRCWFVFLPGVPSEMQAMFAEVRQNLQARFALTPNEWVVLRSVGLGESAIQQALMGLALPNDVRLGFRAAIDEVQTKLWFPPDMPADLKQRCVQQVADLLGAHVFAIEGLDATQTGDLISVTDRLMQSRGYRLAVLETASYGLLAAKCLGRDWLVSVAVCQDAGQALTLLQATAADHEPAALARQLAQQIIRQQGVDLALVQLYAGSMSDYLRQDQSIVLYNCLQSAADCQQSQHTLAGAAASKQNQAAILSLDLLRRTLQHACL